MKSLFRSLWSVYVALVTFIVVAAATLTGLFIMAAFGEFHIFTKQYEDLAKGIAERAAVAQAAGQGISAYQGLPNVRRLTALDSSGKVVVDLWAPDVAVTAAVPAPPPSGEPRATRHDDVLTIWVPVGEAAAGGWILLDYDGGAIAKARTRIRRDHLIAGWVGGAMLIVLLFFYVVRSVATVREVTSFLSEIEERLGQEIGLKGPEPKEIRDLVTALNGVSLRLRDRIAQGAEAQTQLVATFNSISDILVIVDRDWRVLFANPRAEHLFGRPCDEMLGMSLWEELSEFASFFYRPLYRAMNERSATTFEGYYPPGDSWFEVRGYPIEEGMALYFLDVSDRKRAEEARRAADERARALFETALDAVITIDSKGIIESFNPAAERLFGYSAAEAVGANVTLLMSEPHASRHDQYLHAYLRTGVAHILGKGREVDARHKDGSPVPIELSVNEFHLGEERYFSGVIRDITERKRIEAQLIHLATHDGLTGLPNRTLLADRFEQASALARRHGMLLSLLFVGLDRFKVVNESLGHDVGDGLLRQVTSRFQGLLRPGDTLARWSGDEFALLLTDSPTREYGCELALDLAQALKEPLEAGEREHFLTASVGVAVFPHDGDSFDALLNRAATAMHQAKQQGGNVCHFFTDEMDAKARERLRLEGDLHRALQRGEFELHYQPKVDMRSRQVTGMEALMRWNHPELGMVSPVKFIPLAEETGLIIAIGRWALETACTQTLAWQRAGSAPLRVAVNVSAVQFRHSEFVDMVRRSLSDTGLPPHSLELEVTESVVIGDVDRTIAILQDLRALGVHVAMDDFGTGYSSLQYLTRFPIDCLKIDRSFVKSVDEDHPNRAVATAILAMARSIGLSVVAEGVETATQWRFLELQGCDEVQGYYISRPVPADEFERLFSSGVLPAA